MADLMQKTKKELVSMIEEAELAVQSLQNELMVSQQDNKKLQSQVQQQQNMIQAINEKIRELIAERDIAVKEQHRLHAELENALCEQNRMQNEASSAKASSAAMSAEYASLKERYDANEQHARDRRCQSDMAYELFKSFVDSDSRKTLLIDAAYSICYVNRSAAAHLQLPETGGITGRRLFDYFAYKEALKVKKKIDAAFFSGEKEKIKKIAFLSPSGAEIPIDLKIRRVRYRDKPSIRLTVK
jgi:hypothetical protein